MKKNKFLLVGCGYMGIEYAKVLKAMNLKFDVIGRGQKSSNKFLNTQGISVKSLNLDEFLISNDEIYSAAIVCVNINQLFKVTKTLIEKNFNKILVEKPAGIDSKEIKILMNIADKYKSNVYVAYNRRFYVSVKKCLSMLKSQGGISSINFDFTEIVNKIKKLKLDKEVKKNWLLGNSSHVIDLAFFIAGHPIKMKYISSGKLTWHLSASKFSGFGITDQNIQFSYHSDWNAPGRWGISILTKKTKILLQPLEELRIQQHGSFEIKKILIPNEIDEKFKPGLYKMVNEFTKTKIKNIPSIKEQYLLSKIICKIGNYSN
jgi:predicted dehydrogenase